MAMNLKTPGVYIQEISTLPSSVAGVETAIPAFVGYVQKADRNGEGIPMFTPVRITSFLDYEAIFGGPEPQGFEISVDDVEVDGNTTRTVTVVKDTDESIFRMYYNVRMYFSNGGGPCWIVPVGLYALTTVSNFEQDLKDGLYALEKESEPTLLLYPDVLSLGASAIKDVNEAAIDQCNRLKNRFVVMDVKQVDTTDPLNDASAFRNTMVGIEALKYGAAYYPYLNTTMNFGISQLLLQVTDYSLTEDGNPVPTDFEAVKNFNGYVSKAIQGSHDALNYLKVATKTLTVADADDVKDIIAGIRSNIENADGETIPAEFSTAETGIQDIFQTSGVLENAEGAANVFADPSGQTIANAYALKTALANLLTALQGVMDAITDGYNDSATNFIGGNLNYLQNNRPSIYSEVIAAINGFRVTMNPSGTMAGIYARVDNNRGVWQAPANVGVRNVIGPSVLVTNQQQGGFNIDSTSGKSINVIRTFTGRGTIPWGARTLDGNSNEWRYVNVRRLFIYLEESIKRASQFVVFEPNDANTWVRTKGMISNFLTDVWRSGGLVGATAEEAFFVNIGVGTSMTATDVLEGRMIIEIGVAAVRPAEFIILRFTHFVQE